MKTLISAILVVFFAQGASAQSECQNEALQTLFKTDRVGTHIYNSLAPNEKSFFINEILCKDIMIVDLTHGVFEASRRITDVSDFILPSGETRGSIRIPIEALKPSAIAGRFDKNVLQYDLLHSSKTFQYLLSALNAHAVEVKSAVNLTKSGLLPARAQVGYRDRLASVMLMVKIYLDAASKDKKTWDLLKDTDEPSNKARRLTIAKIWVQANQVMIEACKYPGLGIRDLEYLERVYSEEDRNGVQEVLGGAYDASIPVKCREANR